MVEAPGHMIELLEYTSPDRQTYKPQSSDVGSVVPSGMWLEFARGNLRHLEAI
jgi:hypothetical protein